MIPRFRPDIRWRDILAMAWPGVGDIAGFEEEFARAYGYRHAVWFSYARVAIRCYLETVEVPARGAVVSPFNCVALGNAIVSAGWSPIYVDTEREGFNQDTDQFLDALDRDEAGVGIAVSLWGIPADREIERQARKPILHDFALRGLDHNIPTLRERDAVVYSLNWGKPLTSLRGAMLCTNEASGAEKWRAWRQSHFGKSSPLHDFAKASALKLAFHPGIFHATVKMAQLSPGADGKSDSRFPRDWKDLAPPGVVQLGLRQLARLSEIRGERVGQLNYYFSQLERFTRDIQLPQRVPWLSHFPVRTIERKALRNCLSEAGIFSSDRLYGELLCDFGWLKSRFGSLNVSRARELTRTTLHLPLHAGLKLSDQARTIEVISAWRDLSNKECESRVVA